jgi:hypothetical protein
MTSTKAMGLAVCVCALAARADDYDDALARARLAQAQGDLATAVTVLRQALEAWPQDYLLAVELAALLQRAGELEQAAQAWRTAIARSPAAPEAHLGLVATLAQQGRCEEARLEARSTDAQSTSTTGLLSDCDANAPKVALSVSGAELVFANHTGTAGTVTLDVPVGGFSFGLTGRYTQLFTSATTLTASSGQEEVYLRAGYGTRTFGASLVGAVVNDESGVVGLSGHVGVTLRYSPWGDVLLAASASFYSSLQVVRVEPSWRIPLGEYFSVTPAVAAQWSAGQYFFTPSLTVAFNHPRVSAWLGARYGEEVRPAWLLHSLVYGLAENVTWGGFAGVRVDLAGPVSVQAAWALDHLKASPGGDAAGSLLNTFTLGPIFHF